ncbi:unnamed protein product [Oikopleura dioica]|uniref:P-type domain-containing protein n=1 Tax=Oikopleura dioica TaxID=34765 RepID=E4Y5Y5_OIKDI|nr:unnamed protein product [Oikopleura dioica]
MKSNCCWVPSDDKNAPWCTYTSNSDYTIVQHGLLNSNSGFAKLTRPDHPTWPDTLANLFFQIDRQLFSETSFVDRLQITDSSNSRHRHTEKPIFIANSTFVPEIKDGEKLGKDYLTGPLIFSDQFIEFSIPLDPASPLYGVGERRGPLVVPRDGWAHSIWTRDVPPIVNLNLYGDQPVFLIGNTGYIFWNSNGKQFQAFKDRMTIRSLGGMIDLFIVRGNSTENAVSLIQEIIGATYSPPEWAFGYHLCRWGYNSSDETWSVNQKMREAKMPQEVQWNDIDYMDGKKDFTIDQDAFASLPQVINDIHANGQKYVLIIDPAISTTANYYPYVNGIGEDIFIKDETGAPAVGEVWPGVTVFPDFTHPNSNNYWLEMLSFLYTQGVEFDGIWIDMNEPSNFVAGSSKGCPISSLNSPKFELPVVDKSLFAKTLCPSYNQSGGTHYDLHNLYGLHETKATSYALKALNSDLKPFILSRSTALTSGRHAAHWTGDNFSKWEDLKYSITAMVNLNIFGIKMAGVDVCGFQGPNAEEEMCVRWHQMGVFLYSFFRNHNTIGAPGQEPFVWSSKGQDAIRIALEKRVELVPYLSSTFKTESMFIRPIWNSTIDTQFWVGRNIMVCPILGPAMQFLDCFFPEAGNWCNVFETNSCVQVDSGNPIRRIETEMNSIPAFYAPKTATILQKKAMTLTKARQLPLDLVLNLKNGEAEGEVVFDDGETVDSESLLLKITVKNSFLKLSCETNSKLKKNLESKLKRNLNIGQIIKTGSSFKDSKLRFNPGNLFLNKNLLVLTEFCSKEYEIYLQ